MSAENEKEKERRKGYRLKRRHLQSAYYKIYRSKNKERLNKKDKNRLLNPVNALMHKARYSVAHAIRSGRLKVMSCEICGLKAQAHHDDYNKPLEVRWLCRDHHVEWHKHNKPIYPEQQNLLQGKENKCQS